MEVMSERKVAGAGFTIFETVIAIAVLGIFFAAVSVIIQHILQFT